MKNHYPTSRADLLFSGFGPNAPGRFCTTCDLRISDPIHDMPRQCFRCPNPATNPKSAQMGICDKCLEGLNNHINEVAHRSYIPEKLFVDPETYKKFVDEEYYRLKELADKSLDENWTEHHWKSANQNFLNFKIENGYEEYPENDQEE